MAPTQATRVGIGEQGRSVCPSHAELAAFADGRLSETVSTSIGDHLTNCSQCEVALQRISNESSLVRQLQAAEPDGALIQEPECLRMQQAALEIPALAARAAADRSHESTATSRLSTVDGPDNLPRRSGEETTISREGTPTTIGRYQVQSLLGEGSYGRVYLARDPDLDRKVALKVPKFASQLGTHVGGPLAEALLREARTAARLKHPGIVTVYDAGYDSQVGCFIAMEYVEGKSLKQLMLAGHIPHEQATKYVAQAAEAVHYAHKQGLVHRDLKPANLLIDAEGNVKVADFGLALFEEQQRAHAGEFAGTLAYCSPEQIRGEVHHLDGRTDIWSLGIILYELLTGRRPFGGPSLSDEILHRPPKPPRQIEDSIPLPIEKACQKCLAKDVGDRYSSAKDLATALNSQSRPRGTPRASLRVSLWGVSIAVVVTTLLLAVLAGPWIFASLTARPYKGESPPTPPVPYQVDQQSLHVPLHLAHGEPRLMFPVDPINEHWSVAPAEESLRLDGPATILIGTGQTSATAFTLRAKLHKSARLGHGGWFLGFKPRGGEGKQWECEFIGLHCAGPEDFRITRAEYLIQQKSDRFIFTSKRVANVTVQALPRINDCDLEIEVRAGKVAEVRWQGQLLDRLTDRERHPPAGAMDVRGEFGVMNIAGSTVFQEPTFKRER